MKLSELIACAEELKNEFGDIDVLDTEDYEITELVRVKASKEMLLEWDCDPSEEYYYVLTQSSR